MHDQSLQKSNTEDRTSRQRLDWTAWEQPDPLVRGLHVTGKTIDSYYGKKLIEKSIALSFEDSLRFINDDHNATIKLKSLDVERGGVLCYFELGNNEHDARVFEEDARPALLLLLARIGASLENNEAPGKPIADARARHAAAIAYNHS